MIACDGDQLRRLAEENHRLKIRAFKAEARLEKAVDMLAAIVLTANMEHGTDPERSDSERLAVIADGASALFHELDSDYESKDKS